MTLRRAALVIALVGVLSGVLAWLVVSGKSAHGVLIREQKADAGVPSHRKAIVRGRILGGGQPVEGAWVYPFANDTVGAWVQMTTGTDGRYELELGGPDNYEVCAHPPAGCGTEFFEDDFKFRADWDQVIDMDIELGAGRIGGVVVDAQTGASLPDIAVTLEHGTWGDVATVRTDSGGRFLFRPLIDGMYKVNAQGNACQAASAGPIKITGGTPMEGLRLAM